MRRRLLALAVVSAMLTATAACGNNDAEGTDEPATASLDAVQVDGAVGEELAVTFDGVVEADEAQSEVLTEGDGNPVKANASALVHLYIGNGTSGEQAINTYEQGPPVQVTMSEDQFFKPVLDAVVGENRGSRIAISVPVEDVWGAQGAPQFKLKAKDTAVFVADIVSVEPVEVIDGPQGDEVEPPKGTPGVIQEDGEVTGFDWSEAAKKAPKELTVIPLIEGEGPVAEAESMVTFNYFGAVYGEEKPFDESFSREPVPFGVGVKGLIPAWDKAIPDLKRGSRVMIIAPPEEAYGDQGRPGIPANSTLVFVVDVLGVDA